MCLVDKFLLLHHGSVGEVGEEILPMKGAILYLSFYAFMGYLCYLYECMDGFDKMSSISNFTSLDQI